MNKKAFKTLEYDKIIDQLTALAGCELGREKCAALLPSSNIREVAVMQTETADALSRLLKNGSLSFGGLKELRPSLLRLEAGGTLSAGELLSVSTQLTLAALAGQYGRRGKEEEPENGEEKDSLQERFDALEPLTPVNTEIKRCIRKKR